MCVCVHVCVCVGVCVCGGGDFYILHTVVIASHKATAAANASNFFPAFICDGVKTLNLGTRT